MSKFYILSEDDINNLSSTEFIVAEDDVDTIGESFICYNASVYKEDVISLKDLISKTFVVEFDGDLRGFIQEKIKQRANEDWTWVMLDNMLGTLRIIFEEERPMSLTDYEVLKGDIHAIKLDINKERCLKEEEK